eukprot:CAMPEP_0178928088 /NCGR_PEP_ID=MMETSP0786-20121207/19649_1 /TAXON_ID=186022 /ORGANISM="Thalassionema frauenfeldii, Strain CCMP 1798" /LENGTH=405 /DNA_ID=CAMNT_0020603793 /DNA_START=74 /DNA_END=1287 /DNA_ORIENTATION=-
MTGFAMALIAPRAIFTHRFSSIKIGSKIGSSKATDLDSESNVVDDRDIDVLTRAFSKYSQWEQNRSRKRSFGPKRFHFTTSVSASTAIKEVKGTHFTLDNYMILPIEKYNLLDERFVSRTKDGFQFTLPFGDVRNQKGDKIFPGLSGVRAQCNLSVQSNASERKNTITASSFKIVVDQDDLDEAKARAEDDKKRFSRLINQSNITALNQPSLSTSEKNAIKEGIKEGINSYCASDETDIQSERRNGEMEQRLSTIESSFRNITTEERKELRKASMRTVLKAVDGAAIEADGTVILSWGKSYGQRFKNLFSNRQALTAVEDSIIRPINAKLSLDAEVTLPLPIPSLLVNPIGSLILKISFGQVLPRLLQVVGKDYERRAATYIPEQTLSCVNKNNLIANATSNGNS